MGLVGRVEGPEGDVLPHHEAQLVARPVEVLALVAAGSGTAQHRESGGPQPLQHRAGAPRVRGRLEGVAAGPHRTAHEHGDPVDPQRQAAVLGVAVLGAHGAESHGGLGVLAPHAHAHPVQALPAHAVGPPQVRLRHPDGHGDGPVRGAVPGGDRVLEADHGVVVRVRAGHDDAHGRPRGLRVRLWSGGPAKCLVRRVAGRRGRARAGGDGARSGLCGWRGCRGGGSGDAGHQAHAHEARTVLRHPGAHGARGEVEGCGGGLSPCGEASPGPQHGARSGPVDEAHERGAPPPHGTLGHQR